LVSGSCDKTLRLWNSDGTLVATLEGHGDYVRCCAWNHNGTLLASGSDDKTLRLWSPYGSLEEVANFDAQQKAEEQRKAEAEAKRKAEEQRKVEKAKRKAEDEKARRKAGVLTYR
jgi:hypothetical protein